MGDYPVIAIDGPSGTGKSTVSALLAHRLGWAFLDSGALYRLVALWSLEDASYLTDQDKLTQKLASHGLMFDYSNGASVLLVDGKPCPEIRMPEVGQMASEIGKNPMIREVLLPIQRSFLQKPGLVTEGRDMATVVFPHATYAIFLDANAEVRAKRRYNQLHHSISDVSVAKLEAEMRRRDHQDRTRTLAPLKPSERAIVIDTSELTLEEVAERIMKLVQQ
jgi:cytidylate kinase